MERDREARVPRSTNLVGEEPEVVEVADDDVLHSAPPQRVDGPVGMQVVVAAQQQVLGLVPTRSWWQ
jgi:hypothetical protein